MRCQPCIAPRFGAIDPVVISMNKDQEKDSGEKDLGDVGDVLLDELSAIRSRRSLSDFEGDRPEQCKDKLTLYHKHIHELGDLSALCLSGGGIRSAAFALGVVQALAARGLLDKFDYLSTVSGGGYLGSFLTAWVHREGYAKVSTELGRSSGITAGAVSPLHHLRRYSNYLTPRTGLISADTLMLVALYVRNLLLNWLILIPTILVAILLVKISAITLWWATGTFSANHTVPVLGVVAIASIGYALLDSLRQRPGWEEEDSDSDKFTRQELFPMLIGGAAMIGAALAWLSDSGQEMSFISAMGAFALFAAVICAIDWIIAFVFSTPVGDKEKSTDTNIHTCAPRFRRGSFFSYTLSGAIAGALLGTTFVLIKAINWPLDYRALILTCFGPAILFSSFFVGELIHVGLTSYVPWGDAEREWLARAAGYHGRAVAAWAVLSLFILAGPWGVLSLKEHHEVLFKWLYGIGGLSGLATILLGKASSTAAIVRERYASWKNTSATAVLAVTTPIFVSVAIVLMSTAIDYLANDGRPLLFSEVIRADAGLWIRLIGACLVLSFIAAIASYYININRFSLHAVYRNRLIRTFLGASNPARKPNRFTDFDERDNLKLSDVWPSPKREQEQGQPEKKPPQILIINSALNIVATRELAWQERKALPLTASSLWIGSASLKDGSGSYRRAHRYGDGMTLGTAMTISGAAASPNMGYHSSPALSVLLTLFNVRLGAWLGNPGEAGSKTYFNQGPVIAAKPLIQEALGVTTDDRPYVYLSDGGHFENLGLYEMVRRRCHLIILSDAGCDPKVAFEDLGNAVRKISIDLNTSIDFKALRMAARQAASSSDLLDQVYCAVASIRYNEPGAKPGLLLYIKPGYYGTEPASVRSYAASHPAFPHETTGDQWFGESQFEAYRALGEYVIRMCDGGSDQSYASIAKFADAVARNLRRGPSPDSLWGI
jgi:Patatin-like phospholipase